VAAQLAPSGTPPPAGLGEPWASLLTPTRRTDGPHAVRTLAGLIPAVNGLPFALVALTSTVAYAELRLVELSPTGPVADSSGPSLLDPLGVAAAAPQPGADPVTWSAVDDLGRGHAGSFVRHGSPGSRAYVMFRPALHADARELRVTAAGPEGRAVITIPMGWEEPE
jgi:hypothetical protein